MPNLPISSSSSNTPYIVAVVVIVLIGALFVLGILYLRPQTDPVALMTAVGGLAVLVSGQAMVFLKSQETGTRVDGALHELMEARDSAARAQGAIDATAAEQARVAKQTMISAAVASGAAPAAEPFPVRIVAEEPVPAKQMGDQPAAPTKGKL